MRKIAMAIQGCLGAVSIVVLATSASAQGAESIGDQLLEDLGPGLFNSPAEAQDVGGPSDARNDRGPDLNFRMPTRLDHWGDDVGRTKSDAPLALVRAHHGMQEATAFLSTIETLDKAGDAQQRVVAQLDELIAQLSKQCQGGNGKTGQGKPKPSKQSATKSGTTANRAGQGGVAARDSTDRLYGGSAQASEGGEMQNVVKDLWGHLPERTRDQMLQSFSSEFLPEYEQEIEQYYRRLAEEQDDGNAE